MTKACLIHQILKFVEDEKRVLGSKRRSKEAWKERRQVSGSRRSAWPLPTGTAMGGRSLSGCLLSLRVQVLIPGSRF